ncbi:uncharacterized protein LOC132202206 isoform X1 [Neocloeon triangulifer]|uniref:uncharacterized protein LOC132202206 isoform X1 n=1 Tax=Neocloeon triangulifer TaxID=2078957 RepID=UPI00286F877B|nr:uncharacterized protein LOC132202206 isoform X1 [Neocloeon triangulifer]XP_059484960.1 uncharacterized protein LOC132202206 isoform X1 [Neocloeon triangulifer]
MEKPSKQNECDEYQNIKSLLKSIVVGSKVVLTVGALAGEYANNTGKTLDYSKFGYQTMTSFFNGMSDTFIIDKIKMGLSERLVVSLKDRSNVAHIDEMVLKQRSTKISTPFVRTFKNAHKLAGNKSSVPFSRYGRADSSRVDHRAMTPRSPSPRRKRSPSLPRQYSRYSRSPGRRERRRSRSKSVERRPINRSFESSSKTVSPSHRSPPAWTKQKSSRRDSSSTSSSSSSTYSSSSSTSSGEIVEAKKAKDKRLAAHAAKSPNDQTVRSAPERDETWVEASISSQALPLQDKEKVQKECVQPSITVSSPEKQTNQNCEEGRGQKRILDVDQEAPKSGLEISATQSKKPVKSCNKLDHHHIMDNKLVADASDNMSEISITTFASNRPLRILGENIRSCHIPNYIKRNLIRLLQKFPEGVQASQLPELYKTCYDQDLNIQSYGFRNAEELVQKSPDIFKAAGSNSGGAMVVEAAADLPTKSPNTVGANNMVDSSLLLVQRKYLPSGFKLPVAQMKFSKTRPEFAVTVSEIFSPSQFFVQYQMRAADLEIIMQELDKNYNSNNDDLKLEGAVRGLYVATKFGEKWHRAQIENIASSLKIKVYYIDYGTTQDKEIEELRHLIDNPILRSEPLASKSKLFNVKPANGASAWTQEATKRFSELVGTKSLVAKYKNGGTAACPELHLSLVHIQPETSKVLMDVGMMMCEEGFADYINPAYGTMFEPVKAVQAVQPYSQAADRFANIEFGAAAAGPQQMHLSPALPSNSLTTLHPEFHAALLVLNDVARKMALQFGVVAVRQAMQHLVNQPLLDTNPAAVNQMSSALLGNFFPMQPTGMYGGAGLMPAGAPIQPHVQLTPQGMLNPAHQFLPQQPTLAITQGRTQQNGRFTIDRKPTIIDLVKFEGPK